MAKRIRPGRCYREPRRAYTRVSKKKKGFVKSVPPSKIQIFETGNKKGAFDRKVYLVSGKNVEIRNQALEAARVSANKLLKEKLGGENYHLKVMVYPHQVQRENPMAYGHKADRYGMGMSLSFGIPKHRAAQVSQGQKILMVRINEKGVPIAKKALKKASYKLPITCNLKIE